MNMSTDQTWQFFDSVLFPGYFTGFIFLAELQGLQIDADMVAASLLLLVHSGKCSLPDSA